MCVIAAKYLKDYGWVGVKNRDRNYKPKLTFKQSFKKDVESLYLQDEITFYSEGINENGLSIINAATSVKNDESEAAEARRQAKKKLKADGTYRAPDGIKMKNALKLNSPLAAAKYLATQELKGNTLCFDRENCYLLEGFIDEKEFLKNKEQSKINPEYEWPDDMRYTHKIVEIPHKEILVRTNHGHILPWAGYSTDEDAEDGVKLSRKSSEMRYDYALKNVKNANTPLEMLEAISNIEDTDSQMNPLRLGDYGSVKKLKTTGQIVLVPTKREMIYRPIWGDIDIGNINKLNSQKSNTYLNIMPYNVNESMCLLGALKYME